MKKTLLLLISLLAGFYSLGQEKISLSDWKVFPGKIEEKEIMGRKAWYVSRGIAYLPGSSLDNGTIEVDISPGVPGLAGIVFHADDSLNYEQVYIRYVKSGGPDAVQYNPVFNGEFSWQFYPEYQAAATFPSNGWVHLKLVINNKKAAVYLMNSEKPYLLVDSLRLADKTGAIGVWTLTGSYFSNLKYTPSPDKTALNNVKFEPSIYHNPNAIKHWQISRSFAYDPKQDIKFSNAVSETLSWQNVSTEPDGYLNINKFVRKIKLGNYRDNSNDYVWLKYDFDAGQDGLKALDFQFSNRCFIFFNSVKLFSGDNSFAIKGPLFLGEIDKRLQTATVYLPVKKGHNTIAVAVAGISNGWGFISQLKD